MRSCEVVETREVRELEDAGAKGACATVGVLGAGSAASGHEMVPCLQTHPATACSRPHRARRCAACRLQPLARLDAPNSRFSASCTARRFRLYVAHSARCDAVARMPAEGRHEPRQQSRSEDDALSQCLRSRFAERSREGAIVCSKLCKTRGERTIRRRAWGSEIESIKKGERTKE